eukprot:1247914-Amphidinium_carterae.1
MPTKSKEPVEKLLNGCLMMWCHPQGTGCYMSWACSGFTLDLVNACFMRKDLDELANVQTEIIALQSFESAKRTEVKNDSQERCELPTWAFDSVCLHFMLIGRKVNAARGVTEVACTLVCRAIGKPSTPTFYFVVCSVCDSAVR